ncbi:MAG: membrane protein insertase YidC [Muribaculaceae bacterium]|nr:membrane protein insertase YidC [Muribaculaceae bacterium]
MDKNTVTGLLLMAAIMFGFLYFMKPSEAEIAAERERAEAAAAQASQNSAPAAAVFTPADSSALAAAVRSMGTPDGQGRTVFTDGTLALTVDSIAGLSGTVNAGGATADIVELLGNRAALTNAQNARAAAAVRTVIDNSVRYEGFARYLGGESKISTLENDDVRLDIDSRGAIISRVILKKYKTEVGAEPADIVLFGHETDSYSFRFNTRDQRIDTRDFNFSVTAEGDSAVFLSMAPAPGAVWGIRYTLGEGYVVRMDVVQKGMDAVVPPSTVSMEMDWHQKMARNELGRTFEERNSAIAYKYVGEGVDELDAGSDDHESLAGHLRWVAFKNQFFSSVLIAKEPFTAAELASVKIKDSDYLKDMDMKATVPYTTADGTAASFDFYFGPNDYTVLSRLDDTLGHDEDLSLTRIIPMGWGIFRWINTIIVVPVFHFLSKFISNYGIIILLLTLFIKLIIFPFTYKSFKSQAKMRVLAPEIKEINEKYPGQENAMKRQQETMALYSRAGASPFSGCLPMLLQMPVLIAMFSFFPSAIELRGQSFLWAHDLSAPDSILTLPFSIPFYGNHVSLFCLLMTVVNVVYMHLSMQNQPNSGMPGMKAMQYFMPVMFLFIFNDYASGLSYYYLVSLLITIIQTWIFRKVVDEKKVRAQMLENARKPRKKSGWMARLEEAQRQAQAAQRQQAKRKR